MDEDQAKQLTTTANQGATGCSSKSIFKCCLFYFTALLILTLIFTGANNEPKNPKQTKWWWAFIVSLLATASMSATALAILIYTDYYRSYETADELQNELTPPRLRQSRGKPGYEVPDSLKTVVSVSLPRANIESYLGKTVREAAQQEPTIDPNRPLPPPTLQPALQQTAPTDGGVARESSPAGFVNLTPESAKSPVTVVDMTVARQQTPTERSTRNDQQAQPSGQRQRQEDPSNLSAMNSRAPLGNKKRRRRKGTKKQPV